MALRKLAYEALKEKHHIPKSEYAIRSKVALMPGFIQLMELVFLSRGRQFLVIFLQPCLTAGRLDFLLHFFIKKKVEEEISRLVSKKFNEILSGNDIDNINNLFYRTQVIKYFK